MVTINVFPPPDASTKQTEQNSSLFSVAPAPAQFASTETGISESSSPGPSFQIQELTTGYEAAPVPTLQFSAFQNQELSNTDAPVPSMEFLNLSASFQAAPDPVFNPVHEQNSDSAIPVPSMLPPGENTEAAGKSLTKKK